MTIKKSTEPVDIKLVKLREREAKLRAESLQLQARAAHLNRIQMTHAKRLARRVDAHEKIVLGALVKKAGLDKYLLSAASTDAQQKNDNVTKSSTLPIEAVSAPYDRQFIVGALYWLADVLNRSPAEMVNVPSHNHLRAAVRGE